MMWKYLNLKTEEKQGNLFNDENVKAKVPRWRTQLKVKYLCVTMMNSDFLLNVGFDFPLCFFIIY